MFKSKAVVEATPVKRTSAVLTKLVETINDNHFTPKNYFDSKITEEVHLALFGNEYPSHIEILNVNTINPATLDGVLSDFQGMIAKKYPPLEANVEHATLSSYSKYRAINERYIIQLEGLHFDFPMHISDSSDKHYIERLEVMKLVDTITGKSIVLGFNRMNLTNVLDKNDPNVFRSKIQTWMEQHIYNLLKETFNEYKLLKVIFDMFYPKEYRAWLTQFNKDIELKVIVDGNAVKSFMKQYYLVTGSNNHLFRYFKLSDIYR